MPVGDAIEWIATLGGLRPIDLDDEQCRQIWWTAEKAVFEALGSGAIIAEGTDFTDVYSEIPHGSWARAGGLCEEDIFGKGPYFSYVGGPNGGEELKTATRSWGAPRVPKADVFRRWSYLVRAGIFDEIYGGRLQPDDAKVWAYELGLDPLVSDPDPDDFEPLKEQDWSLSMTLAWVMTRDLGAVREAWDKWRESKEHFVFQEWTVPGHPKQSGWRLNQDWPSGLLAMTALEATWRGSKPLQMTWKEARAELWRKLSAGDLEATGKPLSDGAREEILKFRWQDLEIYEERDRLAVKDYAIVRSGFRDVALPSGKVMKLWPAPSKPKAIREERERRCRDWLASEMRDSPERGPKTKDEYFDQAKSKYPGIPRLSFDRAWKKAAKSTGSEAWLRGERPRKPPKNNRRPEMNP